ncbi:iron-siderophore ABC transporter substrate-binding protein [Nostoc sp. PA-18-2419]|uniref:iron-siderophore ABC transporter substrate-binding protein n=1 Tax=Nostoc sp. PA-18-2419 TaxID=2575443 RepID=UPI00110912F7|nr:iron-siderophore ABC transporter substrate-binding protein [Nostoc sp. PA-18-2419]
MAIVKVTIMQKWLSLMALLLLLFLYSCNLWTLPANKDYLSTKSPDKTSMRVVKHVMGETMVPTHPQRVAVLVPALLEPTFALGIKPIAASKDAVDDLQQLVGKLKGIEDIGFESPNLEKLLRIKPDLILGLSSHQDIYSLLSHIAPTVLGTFDSNAPWKGFLTFTADALGKTDLAQQLMTNYYARLAQLRASMNQRTVVSVVELRSDGLFLPEKASFEGEVFRDAGIKRPPNQLLSFETSIRLRLGGRYAFLPISEELLHEVDGDILFLVKDWSAASPNLKSIQQHLLTSPLWHKLKVVQRSKVYEVGSYWRGMGPISANLIIDDLVRYLTKPIKST